MNELAAADVADSMHAPGDDAVNVIVARGPGGAFAVAGIATLVVVALYIAFYVFAYLPRGIVR